MATQSRTSSPIRLTERFQRIFGRDALVGWLIGAPAFISLFIFLIGPFFYSIGLSFYNRRLIQPPTLALEYQGLENYDRLLNISVITLEPLIDEDTGEILRDEDTGEIEYPRLRRLIRTDPAYEKWDGFGELQSVDLLGTHYVIIAKDPLFWISMFNTTRFVIFVLPLQIGTALIMALLVNQNLPGIKIFRTLYFTPVVTSMVVVSIVWTYLYDGDVGLINSVTEDIPGIGRREWLREPQTAMLSIVIMSAWQGMGFQMIIFLAGLQGIPATLYEAAAIDGANAWQRFRHVTIPGLRNAFIFIIIQTTIAAFALYTQIAIMTPDGGTRDSTRTIMFHIVETGFRDLRTSYGATISVVYFVLILIIALIQRRVLTNKDATG